MVTDFIYRYWNNYFDKKQIKKLNCLIDKNFDFYEDYKDSAKGSDGTNKKSAVIKQIYYKKIKHLLDDFQEEFTNSANVHFGFKIFGMNDMEKCNLNIYSSKNLGKYDWHVDLSMSKIYDIKLTVLINVSEKKYQGGEFYIFNTNEIEVKELNVPGSAIVFPSYLNHKVMPVTKGERKTLTLFLIGSKFQ